MIGFRSSMIIERALRPSIARPQYIFPRFEDGVPTCEPWRAVACAWREWVRYESIAADSGTTRKVQQKLRRLR